MMISSDPVVSSPDPVDTSSFLSSPDKTPLIANEVQKNNEEQGEEEDEAQEETALHPSEENAVADLKTSERNSKVDRATEGEEDDVENGSDEGGEVEHQPQLKLSVPDLINKDPPQLEPRVKPCEVWLKVSDSRLASTPCSGKTPCRISLGEEVLLGNGAPCSKGSGVSPDESEPHPDLLSFD